MTHCRRRRLRHQPIKLVDIIGQASMINTNICALHVEDHEVLGRGVGLILADSFSVQTEIVRTSDDAFAALRRRCLGKQPLDVIITDASHPGITGPAFVRAIRNLADDMTVRGGMRVRWIPIVVFSMIARQADYARVDPAIRVVDKAGAGIKPLAAAIDTAIRDYREALLSDLHEIGIGITCRGGRFELYRCFATRRPPYESKYFSAADESQAQETVRAQRRLLLIGDRAWTAELAIAELEAMLNDPHKSERDFHLFFRAHPEFLYQGRYQEHWSEPELVGKQNGVLRPDFVLRPASSADVPGSWKIIELKRPTAPLVAGRAAHGDTSHHLSRAVAQLRDYKDYFDDPRNATRIRARFGSDVRLPKLALIIGRLPSRMQERHMRARSRTPDIEFITYDEMIEFRRGQVDLWYH